MRKLIGTFSLILVGLSASQIAKADVCNAAGNLVANCGFETGDFTGWTGGATTDGSSYVTSITGNGLGVFTVPYSGNDFASLGTVGSTSTLSQTIATTAGLYDISFALTNDTSSSLVPLYTNSFQAVFGGATVFSESAVAQSGYTLYNFLAAATGASTTLSFTERNDAGEFGLDSVSVTPVPTPEPSSLILLGTGALGLVGAARRRLKV